MWSWIFSVNVNPLGMLICLGGSPESIAFCTRISGQLLRKPAGTVVRGCRCPGRSDDLRKRGGGTDLPADTGGTAEKRQCSSHHLLRSMNGVEILWDRNCFFLFKRGGIFFLKHIGIPGFLRQSSRRSIFLCTPANPTGHDPSGRSFKKCRLLQETGDPAGSGRMLLWNSLMRSEAAAVSANFSTGDRKTGTWRESLFLLRAFTRHMPWRDYGWIWILYKQRALRTDGGQLAAFEVLILGRQEGIWHNGKNLYPF